MSSALMRGRTLNPYAARDAKRWREERIGLLKRKLSDGTITMDERRELKWKWGISLEVKEENNEGSIHTPTNNP